MKRYTINDYMTNYNKIVAAKDVEKGTLHVRVDYLAHGDAVRFLIDGEKEFTVSKKLLHRDSKNIMYAITVKNVGHCSIDNMITLYSEDSGVFPRHSLFRRQAIGKEAPIAKLKPGKKVKLLFFTWQIESKEEALRLIRDVPNDAIYEHKVLSVFERLHDSLKDDYGLFSEGLQYSKYVINYASISLKGRLAKQEVLV